MRPHSERLAAVLVGPVVEWSARAESWYAGELLDAAVPIQSGTLTTDSTTLFETATVTLSVPFDGAFDVRDVRHPLGRYGQRLRLFVDITSPLGDVESIPLGWYRITSSAKDGPLVSVTAADLSVEVDHARLITPVQLTTADEEFDPADVFTYLLTGIVPVAVLDELPTLTGALYVERDRYQGLKDVLQAASAMARIDTSGAAVIRTADGLETQEPVHTFKDGVGGTLLDLQPDEDVSAGFNACVVQGVTGEGAPVYGGAFVTSGPMAWPVQPGIVSAYGARPGYFSSPLLRDSYACRRAARTTLTRWLRGANGTFTITSAPDPRPEVNDVLTMRKAGVEHRGLAQSITLPLTADSGAMTTSGVLL